MALQGAAAIRAQIQSVMPTVIASGLLVSLCTIQQPDGNTGPTGGPSGVYVNVAGIVNIPCIAAPLEVASIQATEMKAVEEIAATAPLHVLLDGWFPQIENGVAAGWIAVIDGTSFDLLGAESDSQGQMTRLKLKVTQI